MTNFRIIPKIEVKRFNLVKGIKLEGLRVLGNPIQFIKEYEDLLADEILIEDVMASLLDYVVEESLINNIVSSTSTALSAGAERVVLCSGLVKNLTLINKISEKYGSQSLAIKLEAYAPENKIEYFTYLNGREIINIKPNEWIDKISDKGAGEIHINFIDGDGTGLGVNKRVFEYLRKKISVPLIYSGGVSQLKHLNILQELGADGAAIASSLHYGFINRDLYQNKNNKDFYIRSSNKEDIGNYEWLLNGYGEDYSVNQDLLDLKIIKKKFSNGRI